MLPIVETPDETALVHPLETNPQFEHDLTIAPRLNVPPLNDAFRHRGWLANRLKVQDALIVTGQSSNRIERFAECGGNVWLLANTADPSEFRLQGNRCHDRFCVPCANENARKIKRVVLEWIKGKKLRFVTLTLKHHAEPLGELMDKLYDAFKRLRKTKAWTSRVAGGVAFFETTWGEKNRWHPHLHVLVEGTYFPQIVLVNEWTRITGDSHVVDVRAVKDLQKTAEYVAKYTAKGWNQSVLAREDVLAEAVETLVGRRTATTFGTWRGFAMHDRDSNERWEPVMSFAELQRQANLGDPWATQLLAHFKSPFDVLTPGPLPTSHLYSTDAFTGSPFRPPEPQLDLFHNPSDSDYGRRTLQPI